MATQRINIQSGPSKFDLMLSLMDVPSHRRAVQFRGNVEGDLVNDYDTRGAYKSVLDVFIDMLEREDGSGESWNFAGYMIATSVRGEQHLRVKGYYSTQSRGGVLEIET